MWELGVVGVGVVGVDGFDFWYVVDCFYVCYVGCID